MLRRAVLSVTFLVLAISVACAQEGFVRIDEPKNGAKVPWRPCVEGKVSAKADVCVLVHPTRTGDYWVQPDVGVNEDGTWSVTIYIGRAGQDAGQRFEIRAVANPKVPLSEGDVLKAWPRGQWRSDIITVIRLKDY